MQTIADIMSYGPAATTPQSSLKDALEIMRDARVAALPVCDGGQLVGIVTEEDIGRCTVETETGTVSQAMTGDPVWCYDDQAADEVLMLMARHAIRHVPVLDRNMHIEGIVSLTDMANRVAGFPEDVRREAEKVFGADQLASAPTHGHRTSTSTADGRF